MIVFVMNVILYEHCSEERGSFVNLLSSNQSFGGGQASPTEGDKMGNLAML